MAKSKRIYHHYERLEEFDAGMWKRPTGSKRKQMIEEASDLMRCPEEFKVAMATALEEWPLSCEHNLTSMDSNRIAWLGHAGCCVAIGSPEECTRVAWHTLTKDEQDAANNAAAEVLANWDAANLEDQPNQMALF